jgi:hypothetical protein
MTDTQKFEAKLKTLIDEAAANGVTFIDVFTLMELKALEMRRAYEMVSRFKA